MFVLELNEVKSAMFAKGLKVETDLNLWHKRIGHINLQKLQNMQSKGVIIGLPNFTTKEITRGSSDVGSDVAEISPIEPPSTAENDSSKQAQNEIEEVIIE